jgi:hypothetical protein
LIDYKDIANEPERVLKRVQDFLGVKYANINQDKMNSSFSGRRKGHLEAADIFWMRIISGKALSGFNISKRKIPLNPIRIIWSIIILPFWIIRAFADVHKFTGRSGIISYLWRWLNVNK